MQIDPKYSLDLPVTCVQASILKDSIIDYSNNPARRKSGRLFEYSGWEPTSCCILGRYTDLKAASRKLNATAGLDQVLSLSDDEFPVEIRRTGRAFLRDLVELSDNDSFWRKTTPTRAVGSTAPVAALTALGKSAVRSIIAKHGLAGISQVNGLSALVA